MLSGMEKISNRPRVNSPKNMCYLSMFCGVSQRIVDSWIGENRCLSNENQNIQFKSHNFKYQKINNLELNLWQLGISYFTLVFFQSVRAHQVSSLREPLSWNKLFHSFYTVQILTDKKQVLYHPLIRYVSPIFTFTRSIKNELLLLTLKKFYLSGISEYFAKICDWIRVKSLVGIHDLDSPRKAKRQAAFPISGF